MSTISTSPARATGLVLRLFLGALAGAANAGSPDAPDPAPIPIPIPASTPTPAPTPIPTPGVPARFLAPVAADIAVEGGKTYAVAVGDFTGDGTPDLAVANGTVLAGNGDGTFGVRRAGAYPLDDAIATGDFNGDGRLDVATANTDASAVRVLLNGGDGTFPATEAPTYAVGRNPCGVVAADFDGDGRMDIATASVLNTVTVLRNKGDGSFPAADAPAYPAGPQGGVPYALAVGDFNGDGKPDLATANAYSRVVAVLLNRGDGTFAAPAAGVPAYAVGGTPYAVAAGDFDGDGRLDIATANKDTGTVAVLLNRGEGRFTADPPEASTPPTTYAVGRSPRSLAVADFNNDGKPDLVAANFVEGTIAVLLNQGDGTFPATGNLSLSASKPETQGRSYPGVVVAGDFDGDGAPDLVTANYGDGTVAVQRNATAVPKTPEGNRGHQDN